MPAMRFPIPSIESYMPSIEARLSPDQRIIEGRNFTWDSKGPKSGFGAVQLTPFPIEKPRDVQSIRIEGRTLTFTQDAIMSWRDNVPYDWELLHLFATELNANTRFPWQAIFLGGYLYLAHPLRGLLEAEAFSDTSKLWLVPKIPGSGTNQIPGLPTGIKGMLNVRGRAVLVNDTHITWSGVGDMSDLTPSEGGPGFQRIDGVSSGRYVAITSYQNGFIVWTTKGAISAEYIGGDEVWRFDVLVSQERPLSAWTVLEVSAGMTAMLTNHGMFVSPDSPQAWTPEFNEFFREYVQHQPQKNFFFRLDYDADAETIYILESESGEKFSRAFVLKPTLNKWGVFNVESYGMGQLTSGDFGYVRWDGFAYVFRDVFYREEEPPVEAGYDRHKPRFQKRMLIPSSTSRSRALTWPLALPSEIRDVNRSGWYAQGEFIASPPAEGGMDSYVHIGYLRNNAMNMSADAYAEFQEITIHSIPTQPTFEVDFTTEWNEGYFYPVIDDWNHVGTLTPSDVTTDYMVLSGVMDWLVLSSQSDWLYETRWIYTPPVGLETEDWNLPGGTEDLNINASRFPLLDYLLSIHASQDGITVDDYVPELAKYSLGSREFTTITSGSLHYLRIEASAHGQWYAVQGIDLTMLYGGQQE